MSDLINIQVEEIDQWYFQTFKEYCQPFNDDYTWYLLKTSS